MDLDQSDEPSKTSEEEDIDVRNYGSRTIPSKEIKEVDRSERIGEDITLSDRVQAATKNTENPEEFIKIKQSERKKWKDVVGDIEDILDD